MWKCPNCETIIEQLSYSVPTTSYEYGTADLNEESRENTPEERRSFYDHITNFSSDDYGDSNWDGKPEYRCPECDDDIDLDELVWVDKEKEETTKPLEEKEPEESLHNIIKPENNIIKEENSKDASESSIICKKCFHIFVHNIEDKYTYGKTEEIQFCECPKCGEQNSREEFKELIKKEHFNQKTKKKNVTKQIKSKSKWSLESLRSKIHFKIPRYN